MRSRFGNNRELEVTPDFLERAINENIANGSRFVSTDEFMKAATGRLPYFGKRLINITFDDGFGDIYHYAYPIMLKYRIPFTVYLTTDMPDGNADLWWLQLENLVNGDEGLFEDMVRRIYDSGQNMSKVMHRMTQSQPDLDLVKTLSLSWEQLGRMCSEGLCTIGSHTVSHPRLDSLSENEVERELRVSKQRIEEVLNVEVKHFSFPYGFNNDAVMQAVWKAGYMSAVLGYGGSTRWNRSLKLFYRRCMVQE